MDAWEKNKKEDQEDQEDHRVEEAAVSDADAWVGVIDDMLGRAAEYQTERIDRLENTMVQQDYPSKSSVNGLYWLIGVTMAVLLVLVIVFFFVLDGRLSNLRELVAKLEVRRMSVSRAELERLFSQNTTTGVDAAS